MQLAQRLHLVAGHDIILQNGMGFEVGSNIGSTGECGVTDCDSAPVDPTFGVGRRRYM